MGAFGRCVEVLQTGRVFRSASCASASCRRCSECIHLVARRLSISSPRSSRAGGTFHARRLTWASLRRRGCDRAPCPRLQRVVGARWLARPANGSPSACCRARRKLLCRVPRREEHFMICRPHAGILADESIAPARSNLRALPPVPRATDEQNPEASPCRARQAALCEASVRRARAGPRGRRDQSMLSRLRRVEGRSP